MITEPDTAAIVSLTLAVLLLLLFSVMDIRAREVRNKYSVGGILLGIVAVYLTGHLRDQFILHASATIFLLIVSFLLFRTGAIGGADAKSLLMIAVVSPGMELGDWGNPVLEAIIIGGLEMLVMLLLGMLYWRASQNRVDSVETRPPPLIPFLTIGYLVVQLLAIL